MTINTSLLKLKNTLSKFIVTVPTHQIVINTGSSKFKMSKGDVFYYKHEQLLYKDTLYKTTSDFTKNMRYLSLNGFVAGENKNDD